MTTELPPYRGTETTVKFKVFVLSFSSIAPTIFLRFWVRMLASRFFHLFFFFNIFYSFLGYVSIICRMKILTRGRIVFHCDIVTKMRTIAFLNFFFIFFVPSLCEFASSRSSDTGIIRFFPCGRVILFIAVGRGWIGW